MNKQPSSDQIMRARAALWLDYAEQGPAHGLRWSDPIQQEQLNSLVRRWLETSDPQYMDHALLYCHDQGLPILPSLLEHVAASVAVRRSYKPAQKLVKETNKGRALNIMANLVARDFTIERASEVAAVWTFDQCNKGIKASTLERDFAKGGWAKQVDQIRAAIPSWNQPDYEAQWIAIERDCREITPEEKGERR